MNTASVGFIGGGRIARIFLEGWSRAQALPRQIIISDPNEPVLEKLKLRFSGIEITTDAARAAAQDIVFLATPPPAVADAAPKMVGVLHPDAILVSLAPKFTMAKLSALLGGFTRIARLAPNAPSAIGSGYNPISFSPSLCEGDRKQILSLLKTLGKLPEIDEVKLEIYSVLTAMGPTYFWFQIQALRETAIGLGLSEEEVSPALSEMITGATRTLLESGLTPADVMDLIPAKPLAEMEAQVSELFRTRIPAMYLKIKP